jgi:stage III sporulation protein AA
MVNLKDVIDILPDNIKKHISNIKDIKELQEIRIRTDKPITYQIGDRELNSSYKAVGEDLKAILQRISRFSIYAFGEEIKQGYITIRGGHRVGLCGSCVVENNTIKTLKDIGSINIRICREVIGCSDKIMDFIVENNRVRNTIIISPPQCGKTTLIRDISRNLSDGRFKMNFNGKKVCIIDERSEVGACCKGIPQMNVGMRTDVLDNCPKSQGIMMAIRSMSPEVIVCDEIGTYKDIESVLMALNSGIKLITTIHGFGIEDLFRRQVFKEIIENKVFERAIVLNNIDGVGTIEYIYDFQKKEKVWRRG